MCFSKQSISIWKCQTFLFESVTLAIIFLFDSSLCQPNMQISSPWFDKLNQTLTLYFLLFQWMRKVIIGTSQFSFCFANTQISTYFSMVFMIMFFALSPCVTQAITTVLKCPTKPPIQHMLRYLFILPLPLFTFNFSLSYSY